MNPDNALENQRIAVLLPCYNEELTIAGVVAAFKQHLPDATIYVYDNNSSDKTIEVAIAAGAIIGIETRQGKGNVVRRMFSDIEADIYLMADGDGTYAAEDAPKLIKSLIENKAEMVVGTRLDVTSDAGRKGHAFGNKIFNQLYHYIFGKDFTDIFSGYRAFSRRYVKSFPALSKGFEIETEMSVHASQLKMPVKEIGLVYGRRPEGSHSKLSTFHDGARILKMFGVLMKETQPFKFFGIIAFGFALGAAVLFIPVLQEYLETGLVPRLPTLITSIALAIFATINLMAGTILDSVARGRVETKRMFFLALPVKDRRK